MEPRTKFFITLAAGIVLIVGFFLATQSITKFTGHTIASVTGGAIGTQQSNEDLIKCLSSKGAKMYGAYWCPHCQDQEAVFGGVQILKDNNIYVECDPSGQNANPQACSDAGIQGYPTWIINGQKYEGGQSLDKLKSLAGC